MQVLEGTVTTTAMEDGHTGSTRNLEPPTTIEKGKAVLETSPPLMPQLSKKEAGARRREAKK